MSQPSLQSGMWLNEHLEHLILLKIKDATLVRILSLSSILQKRKGCSDQLFWMKRFQLRYTTDLGSYANDNYFNIYRALISIEFRIDTKYPLNKFDRYLVDHNYIPLIEHRLKDGLFNVPVYLEHDVKYRPRYTGALIDAAILGHLSLVELLIEHTCSTDSFEYTLEKSIIYGRSSVVRYLLTKVKIEELDLPRLYIKALSHGHIEIGEMIWEHMDLMPHDEVDNLEYKVAIKVIKYDRVEVMKYLFEKFESFYTSNMAEYLLGYLDCSKTMPSELFRFLSSKCALDPGSIKVS